MESNKGNSQVEGVSEGGVHLKSKQILKFITSRKFVQTPKLLEVREHLKKVVCFILHISS